MKNQSISEKEPIFDRSLLSQKIKDRLRDFVENSEEFRAGFSADVGDDSDSRKRDLIERLRSSENFQRFKWNILRSEIDSATATATATSRDRPATFFGTYGNDRSALFSVEHFGGASDFSDFNSQNDVDVDENDDDEEQRQNSNSGISLALTGTMSASAFAFMGKNYLKQVVDVLMSQAASDDQESIRDLASTKYDTLQALVQLPAADICDSEHWNDFKSALRKLLIIDDDVDCSKLSESVLGFLIKLFNSSNHNVAVDAFTLLADHLKEDIFEKESVVFRIKTSTTGFRRLDFEDRKGRVFILRKFSIFNEMCSGFVKVIPRYSQQLLNRVAEKIVKLLEPIPTTTSLEKDEIGDRFYLTPFLVWSILDPRMKWWRNWMHGRLGRTAILSALENRWSVVEFLLANFDLIDTSRSLDDLQATAANFMLENLLRYEETRILFRKYAADTFPDELLDRLLIKAVEGGPRSKFAWKIYLNLASTAKGRALFLNERRLRRLGTELLNKERKYYVKIKLLNLICELLKSDDDDDETTSADSEILNSPLEFRQGQFTFYQMIMKSISESIVAAYSRDPDAPLSLIYACFDACAVLCRTRFGRRTVSEYDDFLIYAVKLVKEHSVEAYSLLPILASVSPTTKSETNFALKKFLTSNFSASESRFDIGKSVSAPILWHRPMELSDSTIRVLANRLIDFQSQISQSIDSADRYSDLFLRQLFSILCHPDGSKLLLNNDLFLRTLLEPFRSDEFRDNASIDILLQILNLALCRADFLLGLRRRFDIATEIADLLIKYFGIDSLGDDENAEEIDSSPSSISKFWIQSAVSIKLAEIYSKLRYLGGPGERLVNSPNDVSSLTTLDEILHDSSRCFSPEPSRFIVRPVTTAGSSNSILEKAEGESLLDFFLSCSERKKRVPYSEILSEAVKNCRIEAADTEGENAVTFSTADAQKNYEPILEYGKNLNILDYESASNGFSTFIRKIDSLTKSSSTSDTEIDWFAAIAYLIFGGQNEKSIDFLQKFALDDRSLDRNCAWPKMSPGSDFANLIISEIAHSVETILEKEMPRVVAVFAAHGLTAGNVIVFWLNQCFVNILDWPEICNYFILAVIGGRKYQALFCCCLFHQIVEDICARAHGKKDDSDLHSFLIGPIPFKFHKCIQFLSYLVQKYI